MATAPPVPPHTAYTVNASDLTGNCWRLNNILQQLNNRLTNFENQQKDQNNTTTGVDGGSF
jgi:hypothetical protein